MDSYILMSIIALAGIIAALTWSRTKTQKQLSPLGGLAFAFVLAGLVFGENRWLGYGLMGIGVILAAIDMVQQFKTRG